MMTNKIPIILKIYLYLDLKSWLYPALPQFSKLACLCAYLPPFVECQSSQGLCWLLLLCLCGRSQRWSSSTKVDAWCGCLTWPTTNQRWLVTCCEVVSTPARTFEEGGGRCIRDHQGPSVLARHWIFNAGGPRKCTGSMMLSPRHILSLIKH